MDDRKTDGSVIPAWFRIAAVAALLFELAGCAMYLMQVGVDPASLPLDQRAMVAATPAWVVAANAVAVWAGLAGAVLLLLRRTLAVPLLLVSLIALVVQTSGLFLVPQLRQTVPESALIVPVVVFVGCYAILQLARLAGKRGWLR